MVSWRFATVIEPASEPECARESSAAARSHCEPGPCLQEANAGGVKMPNVMDSLYINIHYGVPDY